MSKTETTATVLVVWLLMIGALLLWALVSPPWAALVTGVALCVLLVRISYELGREDGWTESGRWYDEHSGPPNPDHWVLAESRPAVRDPEA